MSVESRSFSVAGKVAILIAILVLAVIVISRRANAAASSVALPNPAVDAPLAAKSSKETAVVAGGCFWGIQAVFQHVKGVKDATSGYSGGSVASPTYEDVSSGDTGHAESVKITFDPSQVSYGQLLKVFFSVAHDPTQLNRQGPDTGSQYRSVIFYANDELHLPAHPGKVVSPADRDASRSAEGVLHGRGLSPKLRNASSG
jgi:peptide-methionine (S)-S-oxide reductase